MEHNAITIVSGLPRSGTSMMMKMLDAGGLEVLTDHIRTPDKDNPKGYYEFERVKQIETDQDWLPDAQGKAIKMIAALLKHLPATYRYKVVFMRREMTEILASQKQMLVRRGEPDSQVSDERMADLFARHLAQVEDWLAEQPHMDVLHVQYNDVLAHPATEARRINLFLGSTLDEAKMATVVDPALYRQKA
ncbi:MAG: sulfotransferase [Anaerolineae bacterium]|jgi:hypothetical protein